MDEQWLPGHPPRPVAKQLMTPSLVWYTASQQTGTLPHDCVHYSSHQFFLARVCFALHSTSVRTSNIVALIIIIVGFWSPIYYNYKEPP